MELRQNMRIAATRPTAWFAAVLIALAIGLISLYTLQGSTPAHTIGVGAPPMTSVDPPRNGGPGGQVGDPDQASRVGGPGGQIGDAP
jgi:hypothetical protein